MGLAAFWLAALASFSPAIAADFACGTPPSLQCVATHLFAITKASHPEEWMRERAAIAESQIAPGNLAIAIEYFIDENPDPAPWERVHYMARAGLFDCAIEEAKRAELPEARIGGILAVAWQLSEVKAFDRAKKILNEIEPQLASVADSDYSHAAYAAEIWAKIGQFDRAAHLLSDNQIRSVIALLDIATKYPANASALRQQAWAQAERANDRTTWQIVALDAAKHSDADTTSRAAERALAFPSDDLESKIRLAEALLSVGLRDEAGRVIDSWWVWAKAKQGVEGINLIHSIIPLLAQLGRDEEIGPGANLIWDPFGRIRAYSQAAEEFFRLRRWYLAAQFEAKAVEIALSTLSGGDKPRWARDAALHYLALARSRRGDVRGALELASQIADGAQMRQVVSYVMGAALGGGYGIAAMPAIDRLAALARTDRSANLLIKAALATARLDQKSKADEMLAEAISFVGPDGDLSLDLPGAAELIWRIDADLEPALVFLSKSLLEVRQAEAFRDFAKQIASSSPADALKIVGRISDPKYQLEALSSVAEALLAAERK
jgi:hypothetical protein